MKGTDTDRIANVVTPTLTIFLPEKSKATGTGVIIAPGGGFSYLTIEKEGSRVATWLQAKGIAAFVLKYRVRQMTPEQIQAIGARRSGPGGNVGGAAQAPGGRGAPQTDAGGRRAEVPPAGAPQGRGTAGAAAGGMDSMGQYGMADGIQAVKVLRQRAQEFGLTPNRIGFAGFSAGGMVASGVLLQEDPEARPAFVAPIYGGPFGAMPVIPKNLPPVFLAWAQDDQTAGTACVRFYEALKAAGSNPEVHIYKSGGHGFGMSPQGSTCDHWIDEFYFWLEALGLTTPAK